MIKDLQKLFALVLVFCSFLGSSNAWAQVQYEPFAGTGNLINKQGWASHSGTAGQIQIISGNLNFNGLPASEGNKIAIMSSASEDANLALTSIITSGSVYASFLIKPESGFSANNTVGAYFMHFITGAGATPGNTFVSRLSIREGSEANTFNLGVLNNSGGTATSEVVFGQAPVNYAVGQTYLVVIKFDIGANTSSLWVNPETGSSEASATVSNSFGTSPTATQIASLAVRQATGTGNIEIDEIRVGTTWAAVTPTGAPVTTPTITPSTGSLNFGDKLIGTSSVQSYMLSAVNIAEGGNVVLTATTPFTISTSETGEFSSTLTLSGTELATEKRIYVKVTPSTAGEIAGEIVHTSDGATNAVVGLVVNGSTAFAQNFNICSGELPGGWSEYSVSGAQNWACTTFGKQGNGVQMSGFASGNNANVDWLISPAMDLTALTIPLLSVNYRTRFEGNDLIIKVSTDYSGTGNPADATWTDLEVLSADNADVWKLLEKVNLSAHKSENTYVAFVYTSTTESAARWTLDNFEVSNVESYLSIADVSHDFGISPAWTPTDVVFHSFKAVGFEEDLVISSTKLDPDTDSHLDFELSKTNTDGSFGTSVTYTPEELADGTDEKLYIRFLPKSTYIHFESEIVAISGSDFVQSLGIVKGSSITKESTLDIATWNIEWFGSPTNGPTNEELQYDNVKSVLAELNADIIGVQEIVDEAKMSQLAQEIGYQYISKPVAGAQKIGFLYNPSVVTVKKEKVLLSHLYESIKAGTTTLEGYPNNNSNLFWASGRLPYLVEFEAIVDGKKQTFSVVNIHAKANSGDEMIHYDRRKYDVKVLKDSLDAQYADANLILLGDFNDDVTKSVVGTNNPSSYEVFVSDPGYVTLTYALSQAGAFTYESSSYQSFLDHMITSRSLEDEYINQSIRIERGFVSKIANYTGTTSDHIPVSARFYLTGTAVTTPFITFSEASVSKTEDAGSFNVALTLSSAAETAQTVTIGTEAGATASTADYTVTGATNGIVTVTIPANTTAVNFQVNIIDDTEDEDDEQVTFVISSASNGLEIGTQKRFTLTIVDNDTPTGIADGTKGQFTVYPNPTAGAVRLALPERIAAQAKVNLVVYSLDGKRALNISGTVEEVQNQLSTKSADLNNGMYIVLVQAGKEYFQTKLIKQ